MFINHLAEEKGEQHLRELIDNILVQNENYKNFLDEVNTRIGEIKSEIFQLINDLFLLRDTYEQAQKEIKDIGETNAIEEQIETTQSKIDILRQTSDFTPEENDAYEELSKTKEFQWKQTTRYQVVLDTLNVFTADAMDTLIESAVSQLHQARDNVALYHNADLLDFFVALLNEKINF